MDTFFRRVWRWHFWAGLLSAPVVVVVAVTGAIYAFKDEIEDATDADLRFVPPAEVRAPLSRQVSAATARGEPATQVTLSADPRRSTVVLVSTPSGPRAMYVNPYTAEVVGEGPPRNEFFAVVLAVHRRLFADTFGRILVELATCWAVVLVVSGVYLWVPKAWRAVKGVWVPRVRAKPYVVLRDLHTLSGFYLGPVLVLLAVTGLFFSIVWMWSVNTVTGGAGEFPRHFLAGPPSAEGVIAPAALDAAERDARREHPANTLVVMLPTARTEPVVVRVRGLSGPSYVASVAVDRTTGEVLSRKAFDPDLTWYEKLRMWVLPVHQGSAYGWPTKALAAACCLGLAWLAVSGVWMWLVRRPAGRSGFPRASAAPVPKAAVVVILLLAVFFPVVGLSLVAVLVGEWLFCRISVSVR